MPQASRTNTNRGVGQEQTPGRVGLAVVANQGAVPVRRVNTQGIQQAVAGFASTLQRRQQEDLAELNELSAAFGYNDAAAGTVDEERAKGDEAYASGVNSNRATTAGLDWLAESIQDLEAKVKENPNLDYDQWHQERVKAYMGDNPAGSKEELLTRNRFLAQFEQNTRHSYASKIADIKQKEQLTSFADATAAVLRNTKPSLEEFQKITSHLKDNVGLDDDEAENAVATILLARLGKENDPHAYELAKGMGLLNKAAWSSDFELQKKQADNVIEQARVEAMRNDIERKGAIFQDMSRRAQDGTLTVAWLAKAKQEGLLLDEEANQGLNMMLSAQEHRRAKAEAAYEKSREEASLMGYLAQGAGGVQLAIANGVPAERFNSAVNKMWATAATSGDPEQMTVALSIAQGAGIFPKGLKNIMDDLDPALPQNFIKMGEAFIKLQGEQFITTKDPTTGEDKQVRVSEGYGTFVKNSLSARGYARLERYKALRDSGLDERTAVRQMAEAAVPYEDVLPKVRGNSAVRDAFSETADDLNLGGSATLEAAFEEMVAQTISVSNLPIPDAIASAKRQLADRYTNIGGVIVDRRWTASGSNQDLSEQLPDWWEKVRDDKLIPAMKERLGEANVSGELYLVPHPNKPRHFRIFDKGTGQTYTVNDVPLEVTPEDLFNDFKDLNRKEVQRRYEIRARARASQHPMLRGTQPGEQTGYTAEFALPKPPGKPMFTPYTPEMAPRN